MQKGAIWLKGEFVVSELKNHYPPADSPQFFAASLIIKGEADTGAKYNTQLNEACILFRDEEGVRTPYIDRTVLYVPMPIAAFPVWQFALTQAPLESHYITYEIDRTTPDGTKGSWAFLQSTPHAYVKIGP